MKLVYGIKVQWSSDPYVVNAEKAVKGFIEAGIPGTFWVDYMPLLKHVPVWAPGARFKRQAATWRQAVDDLMRKPLHAVKEALKEGTAQPSIAATLLSKYPPGEDADDDVLVKDCTGVAYAGGADTTVSSVHSFFLAMAKYPEIQRKAQAELDAVIGPGRLPEFADRPSLPYINATVKEIMRWMPVAPLAIAHASTADDEYDGYFIPAGSVVMGNAWSILHDPEMYPNPEEFYPDRFLKNGQMDPTIRDPHVAAFGFGRRICPGRHLSDNSLYITVASTLSVFDIGLPIDQDGNNVDIDAKMVSGVLSYPAPFKCTIKPRSQAAEKLIIELSDSVTL